MGRRSQYRKGMSGSRSVEFDRPSVQAEYRNGVREVRSAFLIGIGLVDLASYRGSRVEVRHQGAVVDFLRKRKAALWL